MHLPIMRDKGVAGDECRNEMEWACNRPTARLKSWMLQNPSADQLPIMSVDDPKSWELSLNEMEFRFLQQYRRAWPGMAYQLNQDPSSGGIGTNMNVEGRR